MAARAKGAADRYARGGRDGTSATWKEKAVALAAGTGCATRQADGRSADGRLAPQAAENPQSGARWPASHGVPQAESQAAQCAAAPSCAARSACAGAWRTSAMASHTSTTVLSRRSTAPLSRTCDEPPVFLLEPTGAACNDYNQRRCRSSGSLQRSCWPFGSLSVRRAAPGLPAADSPAKAWRAKCPPTTAAAMSFRPRRRAPASAQRRSPALLRHTRRWRASGTAFVRQRLHLPGTPAAPGRRTLRLQGPSFPDLTVD